jgi:hypothetical protein
MQGLGSEKGPPAGVGAIGRESTSDVPIRSDVRIGDEDMIFIAMSVVRSIDLAVGLKQVVAPTRVNADVLLCGDVLAPGRNAVRPQALQAICFHAGMVVRRLLKYPATRTSEDNHIALLALEPNPITVHSNQSNLKCSLPFFGC